MGKSKRKRKGSQDNNEEGPSTGSAVADHSSGKTEEPSSEGKNTCSITNEGKDAAAREGRDTTTTREGKDATTSGGKDAATSEGKDAATSEGKDAATSEGKDAATSEGKDAATSEGKDAITNEGKDAPTSEGKDAATSEGKDAPTSEGKDAATSEGKDGATSEGKDAPTSEGKDAATSEGKDAITNEGKDAPTSEGKDAATSEGKDAATTSEGKDAATSEGKDTATSEAKDAPTREGKDAATTSEGKDAATSEGKDTATSEGKDATTSNGTTSEGKDCTTANKGSITSKVPSTCKGKGPSTCDSEVVLESTEVASDHKGSSCGSSGGDETAQGGEEACDRGEGNIDKQLEEAAERRNLSVLNVKSILHHVLKDKRVLALIQKRAAEEEGREVSEEWDEDIVTYEPKLTRSRVRQAVASSVASGAISPEKLASLARTSHKTSPVKSTSSEEHVGVTQQLLEATFSEGDSSDEEYDPTVEMGSGGEGESEGEEFDPTAEMGSAKEESGGEGESEGEEFDPTAEKGSAKDESGGEGESEGEEFDPTAEMGSAKEESGGEGESEGESTSLRQNDPMEEDGDEKEPAEFSSTSTKPQYLEGSEPPMAPHVASPTGQDRLDMSVTHESSAIPGSDTVHQHQIPTTVTAQQPAGASPISIEHQLPPPSLPTTLPGIDSLQGTSYQLPSLSTYSSQATSQDPIPSQSSQIPTCQVSMYQPPSVTVQSNHEATVMYEDAVAVQEAAALLASLSDTILSPPRPMQAQPQVHSQPQQQLPVGNDPEEEICDIATRTRSKHPLTDTSITEIEASFVPPDVEDPPTPMEIDEDDLEWQNWLTDLLNPTAPLDTSGVTEDQDDTEYNYLADQEEVEKEEFRNDRAVKIPQKEVADLLDQLLNPADDGLGGLLLSSDGVDLTSAYLLESLGLQPPLLTQSSNRSTPSKHPSKGTTSDADTAKEKEEDKPGCYLSEEQTTQVCTQIQQHYQLLMQTFVLARFEPSLVFLSQIAAQAVEEITKWCQEATEGKNSPVWYIPDMEEGSDLIRRLDPHDHKAVELAPAAGNPPRIQEAAQDIIMNNQTFWIHRELLPGIGFAPLTSGLSSAGKYFTTAEDNLLVLGMDHYGPSAWKPIQENLLPTKTVKQLQVRVKNQCSKRTGDNVIKYYRRTKKVKIPFKDDDESSKVHDLPQWVMNYHKKRVEMEKDEERKKERQLEERRKVAKIVDGIIKQPPKMAIPRSKPTGVQTIGEFTNPTHTMSTATSKRNLSGRMQEAESAAKRLRLEPADSKASNTRGVVQGRGGRSGRQGTRRTQQKVPRVSPMRSPNKQSPLKIVQVHKICSGQSNVSPRKEVARNSKADMESLLFAAGLEASDPSARYAYNYLTEVKATVMDSDTGTYEKLLKVLLEAKKQKWRPSKLYLRVKKLLEPWPHLMKLFMEFLEPHDCLEANALADKFELESVKTFVQKLKSKFGSAPLQLEETIRKLIQMDDSVLTREKVQNSLLPFVEEQEELVEDMKRFIYQLAPPPRADDVYEEVVLGSDWEKEPDEFEDIIMPNSPEYTATITSTPTSYAALEAKKTTASQVKTPLPVQHNDSRPMSCINEATKGKCGSTKSLPEEVQPPRETVEGQELSTVKETAETHMHAPETSGGNKLAKSWSRAEDRLILQRCLPSGASTEVFQGLAARLSRTAGEIQERYHILAELYEKTHQKT